MSDFQLDPCVMQVVSSHADPQHVYTVFSEKYPASCKALDRFKVMLLCTAIENEHVTLVEFLLISPGISMGKKYHQVKKLLAVERGARRMYGTRMNLSARMEHSGMMSPIELAVKVDNAAIFKLLADHSVLSRGPLHYTPLHLACKLGAVHCARTIVSEVCYDVADLNRPHGRDQETPLMAASCRSSQLVRLLIEQGADVSRRTRYSQNTALHCAISLSSLRHNLFPEDLKETVELLIEAGAEVNARNAQQDTALSLLLEHIHVSAGRRIVRGPPYDGENHDAIMRAALLSLLQRGATLYPADRCLISEVLEAWVSYNTTNTHRIPTVPAALCHLRQVVQIILDHGAGPHVTHDEGRKNVDLLLEMLSSRSHRFRNVHNLDQHLYNESILGEHKKLFLLFVARGEMVTNYEPFIRLMISNQSLIQPMWELYLHTRDHTTYNETVNVILRMIDAGDSEYQRRAQSAFWPYLNTCRSLKVLCRGIIFRCLMPDLAQTQHLPLPPSLKAYITFTQD